MALKWLTVAFAALLASSFLSMMAVFSGATGDDLRDLLNLQTTSIPATERPFADRQMLTNQMYPNKGITSHGLPPLETMAAVQRVCPENIKKNRRENLSLPG